MSETTSAPDLIRKKRDGETLTRAEIERWIRGVVDGSFGDYQSAALLMAIFLRGLSADETAWLTGAMMHSGEVLDWSGVSGPKVDKHSTGGVGDKVSLVLAPLAAAAGLLVPMVSGRGLGHTGGTLDKLEAIPGFRVGISTKALREQVARIGVAMAGQTATLAPADRKLYALRDVTATVESIPLVCASIMSKKLAEGLDGLVLDVKFGRGAFMRSLEEARRLARAMVGIGRAMGAPTVALLTAMDRPLGRNVGNALEVAEAIECLRGRGAPELLEVTLALAARMVTLAGLERDPPAARARLQQALDSGAALEKFRHLVQAQGGDPAVVDDPRRLPRARVVREVSAPRAGWLVDVDAMKLARVAARAGAGRQRVEDPIDPAVGISDIVAAGTWIEAGAGLCRVHVNDERRIDDALAAASAAFVIADERPELEPIVREEIA